MWQSVWYKILSHHFVTLWIKCPRASVACAKCYCNLRIRFIIKILSFDSSFIVNQWCGWFQPDAKVLHLLCWWVFFKVRNSISFHHGAMNISSQLVWQYAWTINKWGEQTFCQYKDGPGWYKYSPCKYVLVMKPFYLYNGIFYTGKMGSLFCDGHLVLMSLTVLCCWCYYQQF